MSRYLDIFATGMKNKWRLAYGDFFAGPGLCIVEDVRETAAPPIVAARRAEFSALFLNDADREATAALSSRVTPLDSPHGRIEITTLDCNAAVERSRDLLFPPSSRRSTLGLAFIDPTDYAMRFDSIAKLSADLRLDLIITFMTGYARRFLRQYSEGSAFDLFMGTQDWLAVRDEAPPSQRTRQLLDIYKRQLAGIGYVHVDDTVTIDNTGDRYIYHLLYASKDERGLDFWRKISSVTPDARRRLF